MSKRLFNLSLNLLGFFFKGLFFIIGAKYLNIEDLGKLGVFFSYISLFVFLLGFEYWYFSNRKVAVAFHKKRKKVLTTYIYNQFYFSFIWFFIILLPLYFIMQNSFKDIHLFLVILSLYSFYIIQEISRFFIHIEKQILSSLAILSLSLWTLPIYFNWFYIEEKISYETIIHIYAFVLSFFAIIWVFIFFRKFNLRLTEFIKINKYLNFFIQKKALSLLIIMLLSVMSYKVSELSPRIFLDFVKDYKLAGVITFYQSFALLSVGIIYQFISVFFVPALLKNKDNLCEFKKIAYRFKKNIIYTSIVFFFISNLAPLLFIKFLNIHEEYIRYYYILLVLNFCYMIINMSTYYSYIAYAKRIDKVVYITNFVSFVAMLFTYVIFKILNVSNGYIIISAFTIFSASQLLLKKRLLKKYWEESI